LDRRNAGIRYHPVADIKKGRVDRRCVVVEDDDPAHQIDHESARVAGRGNQQVRRSEALGRRLHFQFGEQLGVRLSTGSKA
jgi:hypothetical protein